MLFSDSHLLVICPFVVSSHLSNQQNIIEMKVYVPRTGYIKKTNRQKNNDAASALLSVRFWLWGKPSAKR
jgi:hypothetical protein